MTRLPLVSGKVGPDDRGDQASRGRRAERQGPRSSSRSAPRSRRPMINIPCAEENCVPAAQRRSTHAPRRKAAHRRLHPRGPRHRRGAVDCSRSRSKFSCPQSPWNARRSRPVAPRGASVGIAASVRVQVTRISHPPSPPFQEEPLLGANSRSTVRLRDGRRAAMSTVGRACSRGRELDQGASAHRPGAPRGAPPAFRFGRRHSGAPRLHVPAPDWSNLLVIATLHIAINRAIAFRPLTAPYTGGRNTSSPQIGTAGTPILLW